MRFFSHVNTLAVVLSALIVTTGCGDDGYTKNADKTVQGSSDAKENEEQNVNTEDCNNEDEQGNAESDSDGTTTTDNSSSTNLENLLDQIFGNGGNTGGSNNNGIANPSNPTKPIPAVPEPTSDDCIGADQFICAIEVAITFHTNNLRSSGDPLKHHARLSYVSRDWSDRQAAAGSISHSGFPDDRRRVYSQAFPGDSVIIQAENVAYSSSNSTTADDVAKMFVNMWANSPGHRRNMLGDYDILGVGVTKKGNRYYATQIFGRE